MTATKVKDSELATVKSSGIMSQGFGLAGLGESLILPQPTYSIRNNCQLGQWMKSDGITPLGNKLEMGIINVVNYFGDLGKTRATNWLQIWAVSPAVGNNSIVFCTYVKGISLTVLGNVILDCALDKKTPAEMLFQTSFAARSNEYGSYYTLNFEPKERPQDDPMREKISNFLSHPQNWTDTNLPPTIFPTNNLSHDDLITTLESVRAMKAGN